MIKARDTMESPEVKLTTVLASREFYGCWPVLLSRKKLASIALGISVNGANGHS